MHPTIADYELQVLDRRRHELIAGVERHHTTSALLANAPSSGGTQAQGWSAIHALSAHAAGWLGHRRRLVDRPQAHRASI